ncbi:D-glycero-beta-D-manno-heptose-7-phosphate kinase [Sphingobium amiense]|uniref:D-glycero-beta-D-manno-heptose-7-phosphate kinase n=1 Tax=Sphingobium amiense TaxID=135719 RepID=UPI00083217F0|nr:D-glycero-beta-D-manno-heptose-7-phosphate kinase [Sphingobium amiense]
MDKLPVFDAVRVLCVGDLMLDRFIDGAVDRISPESPVPIIRSQKARSVPGGAANVARNIVALGGRSTLVGVVGRDIAGDELIELAAEDERMNLRAIRDAGRPTTEKTRFISQGQHLLRVDREQVGDLGQEIIDQVLETVVREMEGHQVVVLSDYAKGVLTDQFTRRVIAAATHAGIPVVADPKTVELDRFQGAMVITPNVSEAAAATGIRATHDDSAEHTVKEISRRFGITGVLLTRAEQGMSLLFEGKEIVHIPASARDVFDVVGAGDTVVATIALALGSGLDLETSARIANTAGGIVVAKHGTATVSRSELLDEISREGRSGLSSAVKILDIDDVRSRCEEWQAAGLKVGFTNGCFDILHAGHVQLLQYARSRCDRLIVGLNDDQSVARLKGSSRPINALADRGAVLAALSAVDAVTAFAEDTPYDLIATLLPDVLVKGADYEIDQIVGADIVIANGGKVERFALLEGRSTTGIVARAAKGDSAVPA